MEAPEEGEKDDSDVVEEAAPVIVARRTRSGRLIAMTKKAQALEEALEAGESVGAVAVVTATTSRKRQRGKSTLKPVSLPGKKKSRKNT